MKDEADKNGEARMEKYEKRQKAKKEKLEVENEDGIKSVTFYQKIGDCDWEKKEYKYRIVK